MSKINYKIRLQKLLDNELLSSSNDKNQIISAYKSLIDILKVPQIGKQLHGYHEILFQCISQIILTPFNQFFDDEQLHSLLDLVSNACVLSMSQNQIIDGWLQNIEERTFEKPDDYEDDDDDDLYEDATESEEEEEEEIIQKPNNNKLKSNRSVGDNKKESIEHDLKSFSQPISTQRNGHVAHLRDHRGGHQKSEQNDVNKSSHNQGARENNNCRGKRRREAPFDNKYGVDLRLYDCYICGEYGHVQYDCPKKQDNPKVTSRVNIKNKKSQNRSSSNSSNETDQTKLQEVYNQLSKLLNNCTKIDEKNQTFTLFLSLIKKLQRQYGENLSKIFLEKESLFYSLYCHIAQNDFLFTNEQYLKLYHLKNVILFKKQSLLNEDRSIFSRQRILIPLNIISQHIKTDKQIQQTIFNDFQEYIIRSINPISIILYDLIKYLLKSNIYIDKNYLENFINKILLNLKKQIFSNEQIEELQTYISIRTKRLERNNEKQIWKERLNQFKNEHLSIDLNQWIKEFEQILITNNNEQEELSIDIIHHAMWYFGVLLMVSSGHLNKEQYEYILNVAIQSSLFNLKQKFYFQFYLNQNQPPITINELNQIKIQLESKNIQEKTLAYEQIKIILDRPKPEFQNKEIEQSSQGVNNTTQVDEQSKQIEDIIPIIDNHVLSRLISLIEMICSDIDTFSIEQCTELLNKCLYQSTIIQPLSQVDKNRLNTYYSRPISLNELKILCSTISSDLNDFILLFKTRIFMKTDEIFDYLTEIILNIFQNRRKYSYEKCQELKSLIEKPIFGKKRYQLINEAYQKFRINKKDSPSINPIILNQFLTNILSNDYQAYSEFLNLLEDICYSIDLNEITIEFEINRCLLSTIIFVIIKNDSTNVDCFRQRLKILIEKQNDFFLVFFTEQQNQLINSRLILTSKIDLLIDLIRKNFNEINWKNFLDFIQNELNNKDDFEKIINFILETFDNDILSIEQTLQIANLIFQHKKFSNQQLKNQLQFLLELLQSNIHSSPKKFLNLIENNNNNNEINDQIIIILKSKNGKYANDDWKKTMIELLKILFNQQLINIAQQSTMFQMKIFQQQLKSIHENKQPSTISKTTDTNNSSDIHHEIFRYLESDDISLNTVVIQQLREYLLNEQLSSDILLNKFIQALQIIFKNYQKFSEISLDEWTILIAKNRGKIFSNDAQCDELLMNILFVRFNMSHDTIKSLQRLIQSRKTQERNEGLNKLLVLLNNTQVNNEINQINSLPTISDLLYNIITRIVFDQKFNDIQVRKCLTTAKNSWLLNSEHRQKLNL